MYYSLTETAWRRHDTAKLISLRSETIYNLANERSTLNVKFQFRRAWKFGVIRCILENSIFWNYLFRTFSDIHGRINAIAAAVLDAVTKL